MPSPLGATSDLQRPHRYFDPACTAYGKRYDLKQGYNGCKFRPVPEHIPCALLLFAVSMTNNWIETKESNR